MTENPVFYFQRRISDIFSFTISTFSNSFFFFFFLSSSFFFFQGILVLLFRYLQVFYHKNICWKQEIYFVIHSCKYDSIDIVGNKLCNAKYEATGSTEHIVNIQLLVWYYKILCFCKAQRIFNYGCMFSEKKQLHRSCESSKEV